MPPTCEVAVDWEVEGEPLVAGTEIERLLMHGLAEEQQVGEWLFGTRFVGDAEIARLHKQFMGDDAPTDILTFPYDDDGEQGGDIVISVDTAARNAPDHEWGTRDELRFLVLHGLLHVLGWDDATEAARMAMLDRQHELLVTLPG